MPLRTREYEAKGLKLKLMNLCTMFYRGLSSR